MTGAPPHSDADGGPQPDEAAGIDGAAPFEEGPPRGPSEDDENTLIVDLDGFEGPLDVLLMLARNQKVDLTKISILKLAEQYLDFITQARRMELDLAADYLVMASWLAFLKSKLLLPPPERVKVHRARRWRPGSPSSFSGWRRCERRRRTFSRASAAWGCTSSSAAHRRAFAS